MKKITGFLFLILILLPLNLQAASLKSVYPRLANYYLKWELSDDEARQLAKWDLLVLDMEVQENSPEALALIKKLNPQVIILAYVTSQEIIDGIENSAGGTNAYLRSELSQNIVDSWWLRDKDGNRISNWPYTYMLNLSDGAGNNQAGNKFNDYLPEFVNNKIAGGGFFDGVFYDNTWGDIAWINGGNLDLNNDGQQDSITQANNLWSAGFKKMLEKTRALVGDNFIIAGNGNTFAGYQKLINGMMLESFPSSWENGGTWAGSMESYLKYPALNRYPQVPIINVNRKNQFDYSAFRFGLTSTLLGNGFYSFDYDTTAHNQLWWYDEYDINLGPARSAAYNLLDIDNSVWKSGLWRRDFKFASVVVNSTIKSQSYIFKQEEFEKLKGLQDPLFNNGEKISYLKLDSQDGVVLLKKSDTIVNSAFVNGYFYRVFNIYGQQVKNGAFSYSNAYPAGEQVIIAEGNRSEIEDVSLFTKQGEIFLEKNGVRLAAFYPYGNLFRKELDLAAEINDGFFKLAITGTPVGGGPQVMVYSADGKLRNSFFAYDKKLRGGVSVAIGDVDGDGQSEIVTGAGKDDEPTVKIFTLAGNLKTSFLAYDKRFKGGLDIAVGDLNNDGLADIVTGPGPGGGPHVRVFSGSGELMAQFFAFDASYHDGIKISLSDMNYDGQLELLTGIKNFY
ncbi:MAG TPA: putative glycoside hydrolase [Candidatus Saccharimonadales bacterium]|nr:putative glycoside hydrolase [Candidatus Saccharimonadales bacterium]